MLIRHYQEIHYQDRHDDEEEGEECVGDATVKYRIQEICFFTFFQCILSSKIIPVVKNIIEVQLSDHHHKRLDERISKIMERLLFVKENKGNMM